MSKVNKATYIQMIKKARLILLLAYVTSRASYFKVTKREALKIAREGDEFHAELTEDGILFLGYGS